MSYNPDDPNPSSSYPDDDPNAAPDPWGAPRDQPPGAPPPGHHWEWQNGTWVAVSDAPATVLNGTKTTTAADNPPPTSTPGSGLGPWSQSFNAPAWMAPPAVPHVADAPSPDLPTFNKPDPYSYQPFNFTMGDALDSPEYKAVIDRGLQGLQASAAARGTLNDSGTLHSISDYLVNSENTQLQNVWNRQYGAWQGNTNAGQQAYMLNYQTQNVDPYKYAYQTALDLNAPKLQTWQQQNQLQQVGYQGDINNVASQNAANLASAWNQYMNQYDAWKFGVGNAITLATS